MSACRCGHTREEHALRIVKPARDGIHYGDIRTQDACAACYAEPFAADPEHKGRHLLCLSFDEAC